MKIRLWPVVAALLLVCGARSGAQPLQKITINFPTRSGASWPLFIAKEGGFYQKYLALSPQCGFASAMEGNLLTEEEQWRKLQLVVETARSVWT